VAGDGCGRQACIDRHIPGAIGRDGCRAEEHFPLSVTDPSQDGFEKNSMLNCVPAVELSVPVIVCVAGGGGGRREHWEVLLVVRTSIAVAGVVRRHTVCGEVDARSRLVVPFE